MLLDGQLEISQEEFLTLAEDAAARLVAARFHALRAFGCDAEAAAYVAGQPDVSITDAADLLKRGCEARTALHILRASRDGIRPAVLARDDYRCQLCRDPGFAHDPLEVHPRDGNSGNDDLANLVTLHRSCHD